MSRLPYATVREDAARLLAELRTTDARTTRDLANTALHGDYDRTYRALTTLRNDALTLDVPGTHGLIWLLTDRGATTRPPLHDLDPNLPNPPSAPPT